jgi:AGZA family xanthine/uracil permease-like MFS transporter
MKDPLAERIFKLKEKGTNVRTEVLGGATTFVTMAYIIVVNPAILSFAGIPQGPSTVATILAAAFGSLLMGLYANRPIAVAPYMGENAFIAFGIGLFLAFIGLYETGMVTSGAAGMAPQALLRGGLPVLSAPDVPVKIGNLHSPQVLLAVFGFVLISILLHLRVRGGILLGIAVTAALGYALGLGEAPGAVAALPFRGEFSLAPIALKLDIAGVLRLSFLPILLTLFLMGFLDTLGTLAGVGAAAGMLDEKENFPQIERPMMVDAATCVFSALVAVAVLMLGSIRRVDFEDMTELVPAFATIVVMVFTYNVANGLTAGLVLWPLFKAVTGQFKEVKAGSVVLALLCLAYFVFGLPH